MSNHELPRPDADRPPLGGSGDPAAHRSLADRLDAARAYADAYGSDDDPTEGLPPVPSADADDDDDTVGIDTAGIDARMEQAGGDDPNSGRRRSFRDMIGRAASRRTLRKAEQDVAESLGHSKKQLRGEVSSEKEIDRRIAKGESTLPRVPRTAPHGTRRKSQLRTLIDDIDARHNPDISKFNLGDSKHTTAEAELLRTHDLRYDNDNPDDAPVIARLVRQTRTPGVAARRHDTAKELIDHARIKGHGLSKRERARETILDEREAEMQRTVYRDITGLSYNADGRPQGEHLDWAQELNPHNISDLRKLYVESYLQEAQTSQNELHNKVHIPMAHLRAGNPRFLENGLMAAYFGVSVEDWLAQKSGQGDEVVPEDVIDAVGHYLAVDEKTLESAMAAIPYLVARDSEDDPIQRAEASEVVPERVWRKALGYPIVMDVDERARLINALPELRRVQEAIEEEVKAKDRELKKQTGARILSKDEYDLIRSKARLDVVRQYLGSSASEDAVADMLENLARVERR